MKTRVFAEIVRGVAPTILSFKVEDFLWSGLLLALGFVLQGII